MELFKKIGYNLPLVCVCFNTFEDFIMFAEIAEDKDNARYFDNDEALTEEGLNRACQLAEEFEKSLADDVKRYTERINKYLNFFEVYVCKGLSYNGGYSFDVREKDEYTTYKSDGGESNPSNYFTTMAIQHELVLIRDFLYDFVGDWWVIGITDNNLQMAGHAITMKTMNIG